MTSYTLIKGIIVIVSEIGAGQVMHNIVKMSTPNNLGTFAKVATKIGGLVLQGVVANRAGVYVSHMIKEVAAVWNEALDKAKLVE